MSKLLTVILPLSLAFTLLLSTTVAFATPRDVQFHWAGTAINTLMGNKIVSGYEDGRFKPSRSITREEACVLLTRFAFQQGLIQESDLYTDNAIILADVKNTWSLESIQYMYRNNLIGTYSDGTFRPSTLLTRESMADLIYKFYEHFDLLSGNELVSSCPFTDIENSYAKTAIGFLYNEGILRGYEDNTFRPENSVSRAEIATIIFQISDLEVIAPVITLPNYKVINVPYISQIYPVSAVVGCEGTSLLMGLKSKGYAQGVGLLEFLNNLPRHSSNPAKGFVGSPFVADLTKKTRTTIYPPILATYGENYGDVDDFSGSTIDELQAELLDGNPVVVYATMHWEKPFYRYYSIEGTRQKLLSNNHVILTCGYDKSINMYYISDPYNTMDTRKEYKYWIDGNTFERIYNERKQALVVQ